MPQIHTTEKSARVFEEFDAEASTNKYETEIIVNHILV